MNKEKAISTAEAQVRKWLNDNFRYAEYWYFYKWVRKHSTGFKAVRTAGFLTSKGMVK